APSRLIRRDGAAQRSCPTEGLVDALVGAGRSGEVGVLRPIVVGSGENVGEQLEGAEVAETDGGFDDLLHAVVAGDERGVSAFHRGRARLGRYRFSGEPLAPGLGPRAEGA